MSFQSTIHRKGSGTPYQRTPIQRTTARLPLECRPSGQDSNPPSSSRRVVPCRSTLTVRIARIGSFRAVQVRPSADAIGQVAHIAAFVRCCRAFVTAQACLARCANRFFAMLSSSSLRRWRSFSRCSGRVAGPNRPFRRPAMPLRTFGVDFIGSSSRSETVTPFSPLASVTVAESPFGFRRSGTGACFDPHPQPIRRDSKYQGIRPPRCTALRVARSAVGNPTRRCIRYTGQSRSLRYLQP